jgi:hypothetical protein
VEDLELTQGTSFRFYTALEGDNGSGGTKNGDTHEMQSYLTTAKTENSPLISVTEFGKTDSQKFLVEQQPVAVADHERQGEEGDQKLSLVRENSDTEKKMKDSVTDLPVAVMPTSPMAKPASTWNMECREDIGKDTDKKKLEEARKPFMKIQKSDFLSQRIGKELEDFTKTSSFCSTSKPTVEDSKISKVFLQLHCNFLMISSFNALFFNLESQILKERYALLLHRM